MKKKILFFLLAVGAFAFLLGAVRPGTEPIVINTTLASADTEVTIDMPTFYRKFDLKVRTGGGDLKCTYVITESGTTYWSIIAGSTWYEDGIFLSHDLYCQSPVAGTIVEVVAY